MEFMLHKDGLVAELLGEGVLLATVQDALDLIGEAPSRSIVVRESQLHADFFRLGTGLAGEILQKLSNYRIRFAIVGDFSKYSSKPLRDFIFESNRTGQILFVADLEEAFGRNGEPG